MANNIIPQMLVLMVNTAGIWTFMYVKRLGYMYSNNIDPNVFVSRNSPIRTQMPDHVTQVNDNLNNLMELPVLFYILGLIMAYLNIFSTTIAVLAWVYVALRFAHSLVHTTYNKVSHRFSLYFTSSIVLWALLGIVVYKFFFVN